MARQPFQNYVVRFNAGEPIFTEGEAGATMFVVQSGKARIFKTVEGEERDLGVMEKGDFFGEMSILEGLPRTTSARAIEDAELIEINSQTFDKMIKSNIEIAIRLLRKLSLRLREAERKNAEFQASGARPRAATSAVARRAAALVTGARLEGPDGHVFAVSSENCLIGRFDPVTELRPDIDLSEVDVKRTVSRRHARVLREPGGFSIVEEVGALNGTQVNGNRLTAGEAQALNDGDRISVGAVSLTFRC
jgi:CRP-like cAMP-binding protein